MKILVTGASGQLGSEFRSLVGNGLAGSNEFIFTDRDTLDLGDREAVVSYFEKTPCEVIINCAAYTAVDKAEDDVSGADAINHGAVRTLGEIAKDKGMRLIHVSTDYVFDGQGYRPYTETDPVAPQGAYGTTKLAGEQALVELALPGCLIIRTSWVYSSFGANFVKTMLRLGKERDTLGVIFDQVGTPTYARDLAKAIMTIVLDRPVNDSTEVVHYSNEGVCSWYDFAKAIFEISGIDVQVNAIRTDQYPTPAKRPHYSVLDKTKIKETFEIDIPYWRDSLKDVLSKLGETV